MPKKNLNQKWWLILWLSSILLLMATQCQAATCADKYSDGTCASECSAGFSADSDTTLCPDGQKCCHQKAETLSVKLQIPIFTFTTATGLPGYLGAIYQYTLFALVPIAIIAIIFGGLKWVLAAGDPTKIGSAKKIIINAFLGLFIGLFSYVILSLLGISTLSLPGVQYVDPVEMGGDIYSPEPANYDISKDIPPPGTPGNSYCPKSGGAAAISQIANGATGKVTYRMGGKPWKQKPPFTADDKNCGAQKCRDFCPSGQLCLDCSGYMSYLYLCAGLKSPDSFTGSIFKGCTHINSYTATSVNGVELKPGDLVGYAPSTCGQKVGHVLIYIGNGKITESHGGGGTENANSGRKPGNAIINSSFENFAKKHSPCGCVKRYQAK
jgi:hypothetical protein